MIRFFNYKVLKKYTKKTPTKLRRQFSHTERYKISM